MKIISGQYKGTKIEGFDIIGTRPTMDRVKESMIAMVQDNIKNSICLDLFSGTGQIGLEFLSNGASQVYFVDNNLKVINILNQNINKIKDIDKCTIIAQDYSKAINYLSNQNIEFDIVFIDPPYNLNLVNKAINLIIEHNLLTEKGLIICEVEQEILKTDMTLYKQRRYGNKQIFIYKN